MKPVWKLLQEHIWDLSARINGDKVFYPIAKNPFMSVIIATYSLLLVISLDRVVKITPVRGGIPAGSEGVYLIGAVLCVLLAALWSFLASYSDRLFDAGIPWIRPRWIGLFCIYVTSTSVFSDSFGLPYAGAVVLHGFTLSGVFEIYTRPLVPPKSLDLKKSERLSYLEFHLSNWWRIIQIALTGSLALIIGLATNYYLAIQQRATILVLILFIGPFVIAVGLFVTYFLLKMKAIEKSLLST